MFSDVIGVVGGMGSYATLSFFERLLDAFPGEREWDRPRILIDNRCTMPSRVRAILYRENVEQLTQQLTDSVARLLETGATKIILACNTSHYFLPQIYEALPQAQGKIVSIIQSTADCLERQKAQAVTLLASEGTIDSGIFHQTLEARNIQVHTPTGAQYDRQRVIIEAVKQRKITQAEIALLKELINSAPTRHVILGCTEFPVIFRHLAPEAVAEKVITDPLQCVIDRLADELN